MRISMKWMNELVDMDISAIELADRLDLSGTAVEAVHALGETLEGVVVGQIVGKEKHPDADTLWVTTVDVGAQENLTIVCGAQNFEAGDKVPVATVGSTLPNGMVIKKAKLRGITSMGMNCSAAELGMGEDHSGLLILPADAPVGAPYAEYAGLSDTVLELEITPNRPDCLSVQGMAREISAVLGTTYNMELSVPDETGEAASDSIRVDIEDEDLCSRYTARLVRGVTIGPSPAWLAEKIIALGQRPVNNVVDITNYVMFELGQPLHAFDAATLARDDQGLAHVIVRRARDGETLTTLDGQDRSLDGDMLVIADPEGPIALAGVMGGESTEVSETTVDILLEAASFGQDVTSRTSRSLGLISEASMRFERGVDAAACHVASDRAADLMARLCGGTVAPGIVDVYPVPSVPRALTLRLPRLNALLGVELDRAQVEGILTSLGLTLSGEGDNLHVSVPTFRPDLEREIDLVEEVVRIWGMERIEPTLPGGRQRVGGLTREQRWRERIAATLRATGLNETYTYAFVDETDLARLRWESGEGEELVRLLNPMSEEQSVLRRTLAPGLLRAVSYNQRRGVGNIHLYELGKVFVSAQGRKLPRENEVVCGVLAGRWNDPAWNDAPDPGAGAEARLRSATLSFFDGKGIIEALMLDLGIARWSIQPSETPWLQPGRSSSIILRGQSVGYLGEVHPEVLAQFDVQGPVVIFELDVAALIRAAVDTKPFNDVPRFPPVQIDIAIVVDEDVSHERVSAAILKGGASLLESVSLFDVYRGPGVAQNRKSLAFSLSYRASDRTLTDDEVRTQHERLVRKVLSAVKGELRA